MSTFVSLGNSKYHFARLIDAVESLARTKQIPQPVLVQSGYTPWTSDALLIVPFLNMDEYEMKIASSHLIIMQAGGGGVLLAVKHGKVPVLVPRRVEYGEVIDNHQVSNARNLTLNNKAVVADELTDLSLVVVKALRMQQQQMASLEGNPLLIDIAREFRSVSLK